MKSERSNQNYQALIDRYKSKDRYYEQRKNQIECYIPAAAVLKRIAAVFVSTEILISLSDALFSSNCLKTRSHGDVLSRRFLFKSIVDKLSPICSHNQYKCRSPPTSLS